MSDRCRDGDDGHTRSTSVLCVTLPREDSNNARESDLYIHISGHSVIRTKPTVQMHLNMA